MADTTITFLDPTMLEGVWIRPRWLSCKVYPEGFTAAFELLEHLAKRDYSAMQRSAKMWLEKPPTDSVLRKEFDQVALSNLMLALAHEGRWQNLTDLESKYGRNVMSQGQYQKQRMLLLAMANE